MDNPLEVKISRFPLNELKHNLSRVILVWVRVPRRVLNTRSVILATGTAEFEDGLRIENQSEARNSLQMFFTLPENKVVFTGRVDQVSWEQPQV